MRDLNRHRTGYRFSSLTLNGFYTPAEVHHHDQEEFLERHAILIEKFAYEAPGAHYYGYLLGEQTPYKGERQILDEPD